LILFSLKVQKRRKKMKKLVLAAMVAAFVISSSMVIAATLKCTVDSVDGDKVTMTCDKAKKLKAGDEVKIKPPKKGYEGC